jgi:hypothetical protein
MGRGTMPYTTRRRRLSSITRAPCRRVMGVPGQRSQAARNVEGRPMAREPSLLISSYGQAAPSLWTSKRLRMAARSPSQPQARRGFLLLKRGGPCLVAATDPKR